ncbi:MAG: hypothetical protein EB020_14065, partial [Proteobacteria bacterium]|nr:hypothetical protein [Pseudomonadota bacterium]
SSVERALREAEDVAGTIPRRAMLAVPSAQTVVALGEGTVIRPSPSAPITRDELAEAMSLARSAALAKAVSVYKRQHPDCDPILRQLVAESPPDHSPQSCPAIPRPSGEAFCSFPVFRPASTPDASGMQSLLE